MAAVPALAAASAPDPVLAAIERHREAHAGFEEANRRLNELEESLPDDVGREPRVQAGNYWSLDEPGEERPHYIHNPVQIDHRFPPEQRKALRDGLAADTRALRKRQRECGWTALNKLREAACNAEFDALDVLVETAPTTLAGAAAMASYVAQHCRRTAYVQDYAETALATIAKALPAIMGQEAVHV